MDRTLQLPGYTKDKPNLEILLGFGHDTVLGVADKIVAGVKDGSIGHFFLVGGCDGVKKSPLLFSRGDFFIGSKGSNTPNSKITL